MSHKTTDELETGLAHVLAAPKDDGQLLLIVRRPAEGQRETLPVAELTCEAGLVGDNWSERGSATDKQLTIMNARVIALLEDDPSRWPLAGDQLYIDLDLSDENLPPGTRLALGSAVVEITAPPHTGCAKFTERFGRDALVFVNGPAHRNLHMRGVNARVLQPGSIQVGDRARKLS